MQVETGQFENLLDDVTDAGDYSVVSVRDIMNAVGPRSFGALLVIPSMMVLSPLNGVPGVPSIAGIFILFVCVQFLMGRDHIALPRWLLNRHVSRERLRLTHRRLQPIMRLLDRVIRPRLTFLLNGWTFSVIAAVCAMLAITMPPLEIIPFTSTVTALIIALFAISLIARDGLLAAIALVVALVAMVAFAAFILPGILALLGVL